MYWRRIPELRTIIPRFIKEINLNEEEFEKVINYVINFVIQNCDKESLKELNTFEDQDVTDDLIAEKLKEMNQHGLFEFIFRELMDTGIDPF